jgi:hypothetical protein
MLELNNLRRFVFQIVAATVLAVMVAACGGNGSASEMTTEKEEVTASNNDLAQEKWEYKVYYHRNGGNLYNEYAQKELNAKLNEFGAEGWELVVSGTSGNSTYGFLDVHIFKRKL